MKRKKLFALVTALALMLSLGLTGCSSESGAANASPATEQGGEDIDIAAVKPGEAAGFEEFPIGDDIELGPLNVAGVYFQPVDMEPVGKSLAPADSDMHMEADISALKNDLGYGIGDFVPYLTVKYEIIDKDGKMTTQGSFMPMAASDGPHYGANIKIGAAGTYTVRFIIENPEAQGYLLHTDKTTGVTGKFWTEPLVAEWQFDYVPRVW